MVGVKTGVITAAFITDSSADSGDSPQLPGLLYATSRHFDIQEVYADGAYLSGSDIKTIVGLGADAYIPFRENSIYHSPGPRAANSGTAYCNTSRSIGKSSTSTTICAATSSLPTPP